MESISFSDTLKSRRLHLALSEKLDREQQDSKTKAEEDQDTYIRQLSNLGKKIATAAVVKNVPFDLSITKQEEGKTAWLRKPKSTAVPVSGAWNLIVKNHSESHGNDFVLSKSISPVTYTHWQSGILLSPGKNLFCFDTYLQAGSDMEGIDIDSLGLFNPDNMREYLPYLRHYSATTDEHYTGHEAVEHALADFVIKHNLEIEI